MHTLFYELSSLQINKSFLFKSNILKFALWLFYFFLLKVFFSPRITCFYFTICNRFFNCSVEEFYQWWMTEPNFTWAPARHPKIHFQMKKDYPLSFLLIWTFSFSVCFCCIFWKVQNLDLNSAWICSSFSL